MEITITKIAHELALKFEDESDIPQRFKKKISGKSAKEKSDSLIEQRFQQHIKAWTETIHSILRNVLDKNQAWRFIRINPEVDPFINSVTHCKDFLDFTDLLIQRRDIDMCGADELGTLCMLHTAFQREIERIINQ